MNASLVAKISTIISDETRRPFTPRATTPVGGGINEAYRLDGADGSRLTGGTPVIFDPAHYYGNRECGLAMTELFGGYPTDFYAAYRASYPLDAGYAVRKDLYNLYHILNHANLFGGGYAKQAEQMMLRLLAEVEG